MFFFSRIFFSNCATWNYAKCSPSLPRFEKTTRLCLTNKLTINSPKKNANNSNFCDIKKKTCNYSICANEIKFPRSLLAMRANSFAEEGGNEWEICKNK